MSPRERAARKLFEHEHYFLPGQWDQMSETARDAYRARVDAVLDEIREPTQTVDQAGVNKYREGGASIASIYRAMLDAIKRGEG